MSPSLVYQRKDTFIFLADQTRNNHPIIACSTCENKECLVFPETNVIYVVAGARG